jgi:hypothetical protein
MLSAPLTLDGGLVGRTRRNFRFPPEPPDSEQRF